MSELAAEYANTDMWLLPPEGMLDGSDFDIARRYIDGSRADIDFYSNNRATPTHIRVRYATAMDRVLRQLDLDEACLEAGDAELAAKLAAKARQEVAELEHDKRLIVTGQAHLFAERKRRGARVYTGHLVMDSSIEPINTQLL